MHHVWKACGWALLVATLIVGGASDAAAQMNTWTERGFVNVNMGFQTKARTAIAVGSPTIYDEPAPYEARIGVGNEPIIDISGGWRLWRNLAVGVGFSRYSDSSDATLTASIPDPLFFDSPTQAATVVAGLDHVERATRLSVVWVMPITDKIDIALSAGPTFFSVSKDVVTDISVPLGTRRLGDATTAEVSDSGVGAHIAFDAQYVLLEDVGPFRTVGAGLFFRYGQAKLDISQLSDKLEVGGLNYGIGARLRF